MSHIIHRLRERPEHHRKVVAFAVSGLVTLIITGFWAMTIPMRFTDLPGANTQAAVAAALNQGQPSQDASPLTSLTQGINQTFGGFVNASSSSASQTGYVSDGVLITDPSSATLSNNQADNQGQSADLNTIGDQLNADAGYSASTLPSTSPY